MMAPELPAVGLRTSGWRQSPVHMVSEPEQSFKQESAFKHNFPGDASELEVWLQSQSSPSHKNQWLMTDSHMMQMS